MSTNCHIGNLDPGGSIAYVYVHNSGDPADSGTVLAEHYTNQAKINSLLSLGSLSWLGPEIGEKVDFTRPPENQCIAYIRDRDEPRDHNPLRHSPNRETYFAVTYSNRIHYAYLWNGSTWEAATRNGWDFPATGDLDPNQFISPGVWQPLDTVLHLTKGQRPPRAATNEQPALPSSTPTGQIKLL